MSCARGKMAGVQAEFKSRNTGEQAEHAAAIARKVPGVREVRNSLVVKTR